MINMLIYLTQPLIASLGLLYVMRDYKNNSLVEEIRIYHIYKYTCLFLYCTWFIFKLTKLGWTAFTFLLIFGSLSIQLFNFQTVRKNHTFRIIRILNKI